MRKKNKKQNNDINYLDLIPERNEVDMSLSFQQNR